MNILLVNTFYYPNMVGGTENSVKLLAEGLYKKGNRVAIYCIDNKVNSIKKEIINGVIVYRGSAGLFNNKIRLKREGNIIQKMSNKIIELRNYSAIPEIKYVLDDFKPNVVHTNNLFGISPLLWKIVKNRNIKIIHTIRDYWIASPTCSLELEKNKNLFIKAFLRNYRWYFRKQSKYVDIVTAPSKFTLNKFIKFKYFENSNAVHVNNSIDIDKNIVEEMLKYKSFRKDDNINFLYVGSLYEIKGIKLLLDAFRKVKNNNIKLNICGQGELIDLVKQASNEDRRIIYKGQLNKGDLKEEFKLNDVLIIPSIWDEPFGRVIIEANEYCLPVIGSARGGIIEILEQVNSGVLVDVRNEKEFINVIEEFTDRNKIKSYFYNIKNNIEEYSIHKQIQTFESLYKLKLRGE